MTSMRESSLERGEEENAAWTKFFRRSLHFLSVFVLVNTLLPKKTSKCWYSPPLLPPELLEFRREVIEDEVGQWRRVRL